ncbi:amino acid adenylation domain-containing protein [Streptomyces sp. NPDC057690]|uniref:amino acid adenylation domain-containing protein n=1 Tax=Streptomyces sp. NPDC057690 TaxID=3346214 RepID=UPI0036B15C6F
MQGIAGRAVAYPVDRTVLQLFQDRARAVPDAPAVTFGGSTLSYRGLDRRANDLAERLGRLGVRRGDFVPLAVDGGLELPVAMIAAMKLAAPFVPIDDTAPADRVARMIRTLDAKVVVRSRAGRPLPLDVPELFADVTELRDLPTPPTVPPAGLDDLVYGFYTSGSTGVPKCTLNIHRGLLNRFTYMSRHLSDRSDEVVLQNSRHQFDSSLWQLLWPLTTGSRVVIPERSGILDLAATLDVIDHHGVTTTDFVPSIFNTLVELLRVQPESAGRLRSLRRLLIGGEEMTADSVQTFRSLLPGVAIVNTYGPTEASIGSVFHVVTDADHDPMPIGLPIDNTYAVIVNERMEPVAPGETGEICIGGECLGLGYLKDAKKTAAAFVGNPFPGIPGTRLYRTGDLGHRRPDGLLQFVGRRDQQVKIGGVRIELTEIEAALLSHARVREAKVVVHEGQGNRSLVAFVAVRPAETDDAPRADAEALRTHAREALPAALVPRRFVFLDKLPLTPNGKADRRELARLAGATAVREPAAAGEGSALDGTGAAVLSAWLELLPAGTVGPDDDFFDLGGDSLSAQRLAVLLTERFRRRVSVRDVFEHPTLAGQAAHLEGAFPAGSGDPGAAATSDEQADDDGVLPEDVRVSAAVEVSAGRDPRSVLLTGATGFIGGHLLHDLLTRTSVTVHCLVRAADENTAQRRVVANLTRYQLWDERFAGRISAVPGDLGQPRLGLDEAAYQRLAEEIDTVVHNGAMVNLARSYRAHRRTNVLGTVEILRLATTHRLKAVQFISTLGVFPAAAPGTGRCLEGPVGDERPPSDGYTRSKWVAERLVAQAAERGVPTVVHRFGEVMPHSRHGVPSRFGLPDLLVRACLRTGMWFPSPIVTDYTPVDYVSGLVVAAVTGDERGWFHTVQPRAVSLDELMAVFREEFRLSEVPYRTFWETVRRTAVEEPDNHGLASVLALIPEPADSDAGEVLVKETLAGLFRDDPAAFSSTNATALAARAGLDWPPVGAPVFHRYALYYRSAAGAATLVGDRRARSETAVGE